MVFLPLFRPEHRSFWRDQPDRGAAGMPLVFGGPRIALPKTLAKSKTRRIKAEFRVAFLLVTFLWPSKEKLLGCRAETDLQKTVAIATQQNPKTSNNLEADVLGYG